MQQMPKTRLRATQQGPSCVRVLCVLSCCLFQQLNPVLVAISSLFLILTSLSPCLVPGPAADVPPSVIGFLMLPL